MWPHVQLYVKAEYQLHNFYHFYDGSNEIDLLYFKDGYSVELELKSDKQDFAEERFKVKKHEMLINADERCPNRFCYVAFEGVINKDDLPDYAGLIEIKILENGSMSIRTIKRPPLIHKETINVETLFKKVYFKYDKIITKDLAETRIETIAELSAERGVEVVLKKAKKPSAKIKIPKPKRRNKRTYAKKRTPKRK